MNTTSAHGGDLLHETGLFTSATFSSFVASSSILTTPTLLCFVAHDRLVIVTCSLTSFVSTATTSSLLRLILHLLAVSGTVAATTSTTSATPLRLLLLLFSSSSLSATFTTTAAPSTASSSASPATTFTTIISLIVASLIILTLIAMIRSLSRLFLFFGLLFHRSCSFGLCICETTIVAFELFLSTASTSRILLVFLCIVLTLLRLHLFSLLPAKLLLFIVDDRPVLVSTASPFSFVSLIVLTATAPTTLIAILLFIILSFSCTSGLIDVSSCRVVGPALLIIRLITVSAALTLLRRSVLTLAAGRGRSEVCHLARPMLLIVLLRLLVGNLSVRLAGSTQLRGLSAGEGGWLLRKLNPVWITLPVLSVLGPTLVVARLELLLLLLTLIILLAALLGYFCLSLFFLLIVLLGRHVCVLLESLLWQEEVNLHDQVCTLEVLLSVQTYHVVECFGLLLVVDVEHDAQFVLAALVTDRLRVDILRIERLEVLEQLHLFLPTIGLILLVHISTTVTGAEHMDLECEGRLLQHNRLTEELRVALVIHPIIRIRVDVLLLEVVVLLMLALRRAPLSVVPVATIIATASVVVLLARPAVLMVAAVVVAIVLVLLVLTIALVTVVRLFILLVVVSPVLLLVVITCGGSGIFLLRRRVIGHCVAYVAWRRSSALLVAGDGGFRRADLNLVVLLIIVVIVVVVPVHLDALRSSFTCGLSVVCHVALSLYWFVFFAI